MDDEFSGIMKLAKGLMTLRKEAVKVNMAFYVPEVKSIVDGNSKDIRRIEHALDTLLDVAFDDDILMLFKKLCRHYYYIDPQATANYIYGYRDMWGEDSEDESTT